jgi:dTDP-4-dehydrorhamnose 3,5-epimerase
MSVVREAVFDVAVDIRQSLPTFGQWVGVELSEDNHRQLWVPPGFAHRFVVISDSAELCTKPPTITHPHMSAVPGLRAMCCWRRWPWRC